MTKTSDVVSQNGLMQDSHNALPFPVLNALHELMDIGIVIELNILRDWIELADKDKLKERLDTLQDLGLKYSFRKLQAIIWHEYQ